MYDLSHLTGRVTQQHVFSAAGSFTIDIPRWANGVNLYMVGAAGGGGGGGSNVLASAKGGGGAGGGGGRIFSVLPCKMLLNASLRITVGAGGAGGATGATGATAANGSAGGLSTAEIVWGSATVNLGNASNGGGGVGGGAAAGNVGSAGITVPPTLHICAYSTNVSAATGGSAGVIAGGIGNNNVGGITAGGGGGASLGASAGANFTGGNCNSRFQALIPTLSGGYNSAKNGLNGSSVMTPFPFSIAGSGGATSFDGTAGNGGSGGFGCGGGGGGAGIAGGSGGRGGDGLVIVGFW